MCQRCDVLGPIDELSLRAIHDVLEDNWLRACKALGCVHEQSMGAALPGTITDVLAAIDWLKRERDAAEERRDAAHKALRVAESRELEALAELDEVRAQRDEARRKLGAALAALALIAGEAGAAVRAEEDPREGDALREIDEAATEHEEAIAMHRACSKGGGTVNVTIGEPLTFSARGAFDDLDKDGDP